MTAAPASSVPRTPVHVRAVRFFEARPWLGSSLLALPLALAAFSAWGLNRPSMGMLGGNVLWPLMLLLDLAAIVPVAISRIRPAWAVAVSGTACTLQILTLQGPGWSSLAVPLLVYAAAKYGSRRISLTALGWGLLGGLLAGGTIVVGYLIRWYQHDPDETTLYGPDPLAELPILIVVMLLVAGFCAAVVVGAWTIGDLGGRRRREQAAVSEKNRLLEVERDQEARLAADAERMRIAREMHDVVSHSMSVMIAQSDGGRYVVHQNPHQAEEAFQAIGTTGREALSELRRMLGVLREDSEELARRPAPNLDGLPQLLEDVRASGLDASLEALPEDLPPLTEGAGLTVYRIIQEALTNTLKHGGERASATVGLSVAPGAESSAAQELRLEVRDTGRGAAALSDGAGSGIRGMTERARLYGGDVEARAHSDGFVLGARFPLHRVVTAEGTPR